MTTLDTSFLRSICLMAAFRGRPLEQAQAFFLMAGMTGAVFDGSILPGELAQGSKNIAGAALGGLLATGLIECVGRVRSPRPDAKGRRVNTYRIVPTKTATAKTWLARRGYVETATQLELATA